MISENKGLRMTVRGGLLAVLAVVGWHTPDLYAAEAQSARRRRLNF